MEEEKRIDWLKVLEDRAEDLTAALNNRPIAMDVYMHAAAAEKIARYQAEAEIVARVGGEKALGSNEAERTRNMAIALYNHDLYQEKVTALEEATRMRNQFDADVEIARVYYEVALVMAGVK